MAHPEFAPIALLAAISLLLPLPWHWRARNVATISIIGWLFITNIIYAVDALVWKDNVIIVIPVWCDITTKLIIGANFALPAACLCICIHLERVASVRLTRSTFEDKRRRQWFEGAMCIGLPVIFMVLHYIVQGHRFDIIEGYGCRPTTYFSIPAIFIVWIPPILMSLAAIFYAGLALRHFVMRRLTFAAHLNTGNSALTTSRYLRLMTMSSLQMFWSIFATVYALWFTVNAVPIRTWNTWANVHSDWTRIDQYPAILTPPSVAQTYVVLWWLVPMSTFLFVAFFSFGKDAMDEYKKCWVWFRVKVLRQPDAGSSHSKARFWNVKLSSMKSIRNLPISKPILKTTSDSTCESTLPPYSPSSSEATFDAKKSVQALGDHDSDAHSEVTHYAPPVLVYGEPKAIGSYAELTLPTPSTLPAFSPSTVFSNIPELLPHCALEPPSPLTPPPRHPNSRLRTLLLAHSASTPNRPITYPSFDASRRPVIPSSNQDQL